MNYYDDDRLLKFLMNNHAVSFYRFIIKYRSELKINTDIINILYTGNGDNKGIICGESHKRKLFTRCHYTRVYWKYILTNSINENVYLSRYDCVHDGNKILDSYQRIGTAQNIKIHITPQTFIKNMYADRNKERNKLISYTIVPDHEFNMYISNEGRYYLLQSWIFKYTLKIIHFTKQSQYGTYMYYLHKLLRYNYFSDIQPIKNNLKLMYKLFMCHKQSIMKYDDNYLVLTSYDDEYVFTKKNEKKVCIVVENTIDTIISSEYSEQKTFERPNHYNDYLLFNAIDNVVKGNFYNIYAEKIIEKKYKISYDGGYSMDLYVYQFNYGDSIGNINIMYYIFEKSIFIAKMTDDMYNTIIHALCGQKNVILNMYLQLSVVGISKNGFGQGYLEMGNNDINKIIMVHDLEKKNPFSKKCITDPQNLDNIMYIMSNANIYDGERNIFMYFHKINLHKYVHNVVGELDIINVSYFYDLLVSNMCDNSSNAVIIMRAIYFYLSINTEKKTEIYTYMLDILKLDIRLEDITFDDEQINEKILHYRKVVENNIEE